MMISIPSQHSSQVKLKELQKLINGLFLALLMVILFQKMKMLLLEKFKYETIFDIKYKLTENILIYNLGQFNKLQGQQFYKAKIGLEFKL